MCDFGHMFPKKRLYEFSYRHGKMFESVERGGIMSFKGTLIVLGLFILGVAFTGFASYSDTVMHPKVAAQIDGKKLASQNCASCHGKDRKGDPPNFPSLADLATRMPKEAALTKVMQGSGRMPAFSTR